MRLLAAVVAVGVVVSVGALLVGGRSAAVTLRVDGRGEAHVTWWHAGGAEVVDGQLPVARTWRGAAAVSAQLRGVGTITCAAMVDGRRGHQLTASGEYPAVRCSAP